MREVARQSATAEPCLAGEAISQGRNYWITLLNGAEVLTKAGSSGETTTLRVSLKAKKMRKANNVEYAVAVRDGTDMWLYKTIKRTGRGDIFVFWPFDLKRGGRPHASYHADGRMHIKKEGEMPLKPQHVQKPDASFNGCHSVIVT